MDISPPPPRSPPGEGLGRVLEGFWEHFGRFLGGICADFDRIFNEIWKDFRLNFRRRFGEDFSGFGKNFGRVLDGFGMILVGFWMKFGEGFGRIWEPRGSPDGHENPSISMDRGILRNPRNYSES